jgi:hypothetical protein
LRGHTRTPGFSAVCRNDRQPVASPQPTSGEYALHSPDQIEGGAIGDWLSIAHESNPIRVPRERSKCLGANRRSVVDQFKHLVSPVAAHVARLSAFAYAIAFEIDRKRRRGAWTPMHTVN